MNIKPDKDFNEGKVFQQKWFEQESSESSTFRELKAVSLSLDAFVDELQTQTVLWFTDNQNIHVVSIVNKGSKVSELNSISLDIFQKCMLNMTIVDVNWIPRDLNHVADGISKIIDYNDYTINNDIFAFWITNGALIQLTALRAITIVNYFI